MRSKVTPLTRIVGKNGQARFKKMIGGAIHYFGPRGCTEREALDDYLARKDGILAGKDPKDCKGVSLEQAVNDILREKHAKQELGKLSLKHYQDHVAVSRYILATLPRTLPVESLRPHHYALLRAGIEYLSPQTQKNRLARLSSIFKRAVKLKLMKEVDDADALKAPSAAEIRNAKNDRVICR